mmetsp:Transcript_60730/g.125094  ORF Transcript_60730/g.125094 Transcript_60730/m.125094 type:complete len:206 (+) Transcript_60730:1405-2022(+)
MVPSPTNASCIHCSARRKSASLAWASRVSGPMPDVDSSGGAPYSSSIAWASWAQPWLVRLVGRDEPSQPSPRAIARTESLAPRSTSPPMIDWVIVIAPPSAIASRAHVDTIRKSLGRGPVCSPGATLGNAVVGLGGPPPGRAEPSRAESSMGTALATGRWACEAPGSFSVSGSPPSSPLNAVVNVSSWVSSASLSDDPGSPAPPA